MTSTGCSTAVPVYIGKLLEYIPFSLTFYHIKEIKIDKGSINVYKSIDLILKYIALIFYDNNKTRVIFQCRTPTIYSHYGSYYCS